MEKEFVTYDIAIKLKELGFNENCFGYYKNNNTLIWFAGNIGVDHWNLPDIDDIPAPLWQQVIDWFRIKHNINVETCYHPNIKKYSGVVSDKSWTMPKHLTLNEYYKQRKQVDKNPVRFEDFEESRIDAIIKAIEYIKNKEN